MITQNADKLRNIFLLVATKTTAFITIGEVSGSTLGPFSLTLVRHRAGQVIYALLTSLPKANIPHCRMLGKPSQI